MRNFIPNTTHASMTLRANQANSGLTVFAKQHDARSRFIHVELRDENGHIVTTGMPQLNVIHANGTRHYIGGTYNEDGLITFELTSQLLSLAGDCKCDVSIFGDSEQSSYTLYGDGTSIEFTLPIQVIQIDELTIDGLPSEEFTYDPENGLITFEEAPADGAVISVVGQGILILTSAMFTLTIGESCYSSAAIQSMDEFNTAALQIVEAKRILDEARREMSSIIDMTVGMHDLPRGSEVSIEKTVEEDEPIHFEIGIPKPYAPAIEKIEDYLYMVEYNDLDYEAGIEFCMNRYNPPAAGCSSVRFSNYYGRNYDWYYDDKASFIIKRKATQGKHASIGVAGGLITEAQASSGEYNEMYTYLPFIVVDGINDRGVVCNINVLPELDRKGTTTGTNPGKQNVPMACLVRKILDDADSADDAIYKIQHDYNIIAPSSEHISTEMHYMIADENKTYVVEFVNNVPVIIQNFVHGKEIMTNFYLDGYTGTRASLTPFAMGIERYNILSDNFTSASSVDGMLDLMRSVNYTKAYSAEEDPVWYSEFAGIYDEYGRLDKDSPPEEYAGILAYVRGLFANRTRDGKTWQTVHTSVFDIINRKIVVVSQENDSKYEFYIPKIGEAYAYIKVISDDDGDVVLG